MPQIRCQENTSTPSKSKQANVIPQYDEAPARNTRANHQARTLTQEVMLQAVEMAPRQAQMTARQAASRRYPLEFLTEYVNAVLDPNTGELLEYCHLIQNPKYGEWKLSSGNEIGRLAQCIGDRVKGTNTIFFVDKKEVPHDCFKEVT